MGDFRRKGFEEGQERQRKYWKAEEIGGASKQRDGFPADAWEMK
jgi:hypothetical protein